MRYHRRGRRRRWRTSRRCVQTYKARTLSTFGIALMVALAIGVMTVAQGQETPKESPQLAFRAQTDVVVVPFQVRRGSRPVSDLTSADVVLLEDGRRRDFTGFEAPSQHPSLELVVMFDVTDLQRGGFWSAKALHELASFWNEATVRAIRGSCSTRCVDCPIPYPPIQP